ncbi:hypothetical protein [Pseudoalteromonas sp. MIP2626]|nr:hypothetical protein [Pseudoalteromonas sp. MIP2626]
MSNTTPKKLTVPKDLALFARDFNTVEQSRAKRAARMSKAKKK